MNSNPHLTTFKILVLGQTNVGKTSITFRFTDGSFKESYISTIGIDASCGTINIDGEKIRLQIWDTAGQERFRTLTNAYYRGAMGIMLVYDVTCDASFNNISNWVQCIEENASDNVVCMLVGNKADVDENLRCVTKKQGEERAALYANMDFFEVSAKTGLNIKENIDNTFFPQSIYLKEKTTISDINNISSLVNSMPKRAFTALGQKIYKSKLPKNLPNSITPQKKTNSTCC